MDPISANQSIDKTILKFQSVNQSYYLEFIIIDKTVNTDHQKYVTILIHIFISRIARERICKHSACEISYRFRL